MRRLATREHQALLTLLRHPDGRTWQQIAAQVAFAGSAVAVWHERHADSLLPPGKDDVAFADA